MSEWHNESKALFNHHTAGQMSEPLVASLIDGMFLLFKLLFLSVRMSFYCFMMCFDRQRNDANAKRRKKLLVSIIRYKHNYFFSRSGFIDSCLICVSAFRYSRPNVKKKWLLFPMPMLITQPSEPLQYWTQIDTINHTIDLSMLKNNWIIHSISLTAALTLSRVSTG